MDIKTHREINRKLCGTPLKLEEGYSQVALVTIDEMKVDTLNLIHGGYIFGLADHAAMIAVNHPHVVLGSAQVKFLKPVSIDEKLIAEARIKTVEGKKHIVEVTVQRGSETVFSGELVCFVLDKHVLA